MDTVLLSINLKLAHKATIPRTATVSRLSLLILECFDVVVSVGDQRRRWNSNISLLVDVIVRLGSVSHPENVFFRRDIALRQQNDPNDRAMTAKN